MYIHTTGLRPSMRLFDLPKFLKSRQVFMTRSFARKLREMLFVCEFDGGELAMVELDGIEPSTSCLQSRRSPS